MNPSVSSQLQQALALLQRHLGGNLLAVHLFGSAVVGGLKPGSDLDLPSPPPADSHAPLADARAADDFRRRPTSECARWKSPGWYTTRYGPGVIRQCANCNSANGCAPISKPAASSRPRRTTIWPFFCTAQERRLSDRPWRGRVRPGARGGHAPSLARHAGAMARARRLAGETSATWCWPWRASGSL